MRKRLFQQCGRTGWQCKFAGYISNSIVDFAFFPFLLLGQLDDEERMLMDSARSYCEEKLLPRIVQVSCRCTPSALPRGHGAEGCSSLILSAQKYGDRHPRLHFLKKPKHGNLSKPRAIVSRFTMDRFDHATSNPPPPSVSVRNARPC